MNKTTILTGNESVQGSAEWLAFREGKIGASDAASIRGINPWETKLECFERFILGTKKKKTRQMERGSALEAEARKKFNEMFSADYEPLVAYLTEHPKIMTSLDGWSAQASSVLEIKCPSRESHFSAKRGEIAPHYQCQMQHQMMVMACEKGWYCSYDGENIAVVPLLRDETFIKKLLCEELAFLASLINLQPPEATDMDWKEELDPEQLVKAERMRELENLIYELDSERALIREELIHDIKHPRMKIGQYKIQKILTRGRLDYEQIFNDYEITNLDSYRKKPTESWRFISS